MKQHGFSSSAFPSGDHFQDTPGRETNQTNPMGAKHCIFVPATPKFYAIQLMQRKNTLTSNLRENEIHNNMTTSSAITIASHAMMFLYARVPQFKVMYNEMEFKAANSSFLIKRYPDIANR